MADTSATDRKSKSEQANRERREALKKLGRFTVVSAPVVTLLLAAGARPSAAQVCSINCPSSRALKSADGAVDADALLAAVQTLPVETWRYKAETGLETKPHIGPYAEDFKAAFGVGDGVTINPVDAMGICLAAIQALTRKVEVLEEELKRARESNAA